MGIQSADTDATVYTGGLNTHCTPSQCPGGFVRTLTFSVNQMWIFQYGEGYERIENCPDGTCVILGFISWNQSLIRLKITVNEGFDLVNELRVL